MLFTASFRFICNAVSKEGVTEKDVLQQRETIFFKQKV